ncbi:hypothetical protein KIH31_01050 [Paenarthrobacter sp. DKR-5]|uniref:hypothetical protein n=1 Tax=Paenarthrobacter sp. DKR-5 TaxID=2835535 RepID=UPI001BDC306B|nr:hypothetical protein [Paenarthrobacter sp. DKR-5]MBT1001174.1 hypothetical protein [Paenarthrobacter sp. DKR-5]
MPQHRTRRYVLRSAQLAAGSVVAAATVAAAAAFAPASDASTRLQGVHEDLARAVALQQITPEQAARFEARLAGHLQAGSAGA